MAQQLTVLLLEQSAGTNASGATRTAEIPRQVGVLVGERLLIGRECPDGITVDVAGVSRTHGEFVRIRSQYVFADLGSTNGTWVNGKKIEALRPCVMRPGDTLQLAAAPLKIGTSGGVRSEVPSLLVTKLVDADSDGGRSITFESVEEFPIPAAGIVMTLGGNQSDVEDCAAETAARILKEDGGLALEVLSTEVQLYCSIPSGPLQVGSRVPIGDNDVIAVGATRVIVNVPPRLSSSAIPRPSNASSNSSSGVFGSPPGGFAGAGGFTGTGRGVKEAGSDSLSNDGDVEKTVVFSPDAIEAHINPEATTAVFDSRGLRAAERSSSGHPATGDLHPSSRFGGESEPEENGLGLSPLEVKLVAIMAIMLFASVFLLGLWWFSQNG